MQGFAVPARRIRLDFTKSKWSFRAMESWEEILSVLKLERHVQDLASGRVDN